MTVYEACIALGIWHIAKPRAEVWYLASRGSPASVDDLRLIAKNSFTQLALKHHPDHGGSTDEYINIREAYDLLKSAEAKDFIIALDDERKHTAQYFTPGAAECKNCRKWSAIISGCLTSICTGFESLRAANAH